MSSRVGISITNDACSAIVVRGTRVRWSNRVARAPDAPIASVLGPLLSRAPIRRRASVRIAVSLGVSRCQLKRIHGLPNTTRADVAGRLVRENTASFFLRASSRLVTTGVERGADGSMWCVALDGALVDEIVEALRVAGFRALLLVPQPLADAIALPPGSHHVVDGDIEAEFSTTDRRMFTRVQRRVRDDANRTLEPTADVPRPLLALGEDARLYVSAFGAATCPRDRALAWRPPVDPRIRRRWQRTRSIAAAAMLVLSVSAAIVAPAVRTSRDAATSMRVAQRRRAATAEAARVDGELRKVTESLDRIDRFMLRRSDVPLLLADLAQASPESTALLSLRIDTVEVSLSVLASHAADVVSSLADVEGIVSPRIAGSVMRDASTRVTLERATIRARRRRR